MTHKKEVLYIRVNEDGTIEEYKEDTQKCYFCGFDLITHSHHIVRRKEGGSNRINNIIILCPNHHSLIHSRKYILGFKKDYCYLKKANGTELIPPFRFDKEHKRKPPITDIKYNNNLLIEGDLNYKAIIKIKKDNLEDEK